MYDPWTRTKAGGLLEGMWVPGIGIQIRKKWVNCNSIINKIYLDTKFCRWKGVARNIQSDEKQGPITKITLPSKAFI